MLIVLQFTVTIVILLGTIIVNRQLNFMQDKDPGFRKEKLLVIKRSDVLENRIDAFKAEVKQHANVISVANSRSIPSYQYSENAHWLEGWDRSEIFTLASNYVSYDYDKALGLEIIEGRFFDQERGSDSSGIIINEAAALALGLEDPLNNRFVLSCFL